MKILIIRFSSIGDIILTFPVITALKQHFPNSEIYFAVKEQFQEILFDNSNVDHIIPLTTQHQQNIVKLFEYIRQLNSIGFDLVFDLHSNLRSKITSQFLNTEHKFYYNKHHLQRKMMIHLKKLPKEKKHTVENYLHVLDKVGINSVDIVPKIIPQSKSLDHVRTFLHENHISSKDKLIAINPNANHFTKQWPLPKFIRLSKTLIQQYHAKILIIGSFDDKERTNKILNTVDCGNNIISSAGMFPLGEIPALLSKCTLLITNDTGPMHIAVAVDTPVIAFFGPTVQEFGFYPLGKSDIVLEKKIPCRPCSLHGGPRCPKGHFNCMNKINVEEVISVINKNFFNSSK